MSNKNMAALLIGIFLGTILGLTNRPTPKPPVKIYLPPGFTVQNLPDGDVLVGIPVELKK